MPIAMIIWGVIFAIAVIAELATLQLVSIWFAAGALGAFIAAAANCPPLGQAAIFAALSVCLLCVTRPLLRKLRVKDLLPDNVESEVGKLAIVTEEINKMQSTGRVKIGDTNWRARTEDGSVLPEGTSVRVVRIAGTTAFVTPAGS